MNTILSVSRVNILKCLEAILPGNFRRYIKDPLRKNAIFLIAANALAAIIGFIFWVVAARFYPPEDVGLATTLVSAMMVLVLISRFGFDISIVRFLPQSEKKQEIINSCFTISGLISIILAIIFICGLGAWAPALLFVQAHVVYSFIFVLVTCATTIIYLGEHIFVALRATEYTLAETILTGSRILFVVLLTAFGAMGIFLSWGLSVGIALIGSYLFIILRVYRSYRPVPIIWKKVVKDMYQFSFVNYVAEGLKELPRWIMPLIIISILSPEMSAYFYVAWTIAGILFVITYATNFSLLAHGSHEPSKVKSEVVKAVKFILLLIVPTIAVIFFFGDRVLLLFGVEYAQHAFWLVRILALSGIPVAINTIYITVNRIVMRMKPLVYVNGFIAIFTIGASALLMSTMGIVSIGIAWFTANSIVAVVVIPIMLKMIRSY